MRSILVPCLALLLLGAARAAPGPAPDRLRVVATIPDLADIAGAIGGERVEVRSLAQGRENVHFVRLQPSDLIAVKRADLFVEVGLNLEHAYVPGLLLSARNDAIRPGAPGFVNASDGWSDLIEVPASTSRQQGADIHPQGNPHINLHPAAGRHFADVILAHLCAVDPGSKAYYEERHAAYAKRLDEAEARWRPLAEALRGQKIVLYHQDLDCFCVANGIEMVGTLEPKPGIEPTPGHLAELIGRMRAEGVKVIFTAAWSNNRNTRKVADETGATALEGPVMVGGVEGAESWIGMMDWLYEHLARAFGVEPAPASR